MIDPSQVLLRLRLSPLSETTYGDAMAVSDDLVSEFSRESAWRGRPVSTPIRNVGFCAK